MHSKIRTQEAKRVPCKFAIIHKKEVHKDDNEEEKDEDKHSFNGHDDMNVDIRQNFNVIEGSSFSSSMNKSNKRRCIKATLFEYERIQF